MTSVIRMLIIVYLPAINQDHAWALGSLLMSVSFNAEINAVTTIRDPKNSTILNVAILWRSETTLKSVQSNSRNYCRMGDVRHCVIITGTYNTPPPPFLWTHYSCFMSIFNTQYGPTACDVPLLVISTQLFMQCISAPLWRSLSKGLVVLLNMCLQKRETR
jgi:hypothetical protein